MSRFLRGDISLGVRDKLYEGVWVTDLKEKKITYSFVEPLGTVIKHFDKYHSMLPYELGGQMVNELMKEQDGSV